MRAQGMLYVWHAAMPWLVLDCQQVLGEELDTAEVLAGRATPMYFGSAFSNFGVEPFLEVRGWLLTVTMGCATGLVAAAGTAGQWHVRSAEYCIASGSSGASGVYIDMPCMDCSSPAGLSTHWSGGAL